MHSSTRVWSGNLSLRWGDYEQALLYSRRALVLSRRSGRSVDAEYWIMFTLTCGATQLGNYVQGAQLQGVHDGFEERAQEPLDGWWTEAEIETRENNRAVLREHLGDDEYERALVIGKSLDANGIYDLAMGRSEVVR